VRLDSELVPVRETLRQMWQTRFSNQWKEIYKLRGESDKIDADKMLARTIQKAISEYFMKDPSRKESDAGEKPSSKVTFIESSLHKGTDELKYSKRSQQEKEFSSTVQTTAESVAKSMHLEVLPA